MRQRKPSAWLGGGLGLLVAVTVGGACSTSPPPAYEDVGEAHGAVFTNGGFETGTAGQVPPAPWTLTDFVNVNGVTIQNPQTYAGLNLTAHGAACTTTNNCTGVNPQQGTSCSGGFCQPASKTIILNSATGPGTQIDPTLGATASLRWPRYGNQCALVNQLGNHVNANQLTQTMTVGAGDVDPTDNQVHVRFVVAPVLEDPGHPSDQQPYFFVQLTNVTQGGAILYSNFNFSNQAGVPWKTVTTTGGGGSTYRYTDWQLVDIAPGSPAINMGDQLQLVLVAAGCSLGAHMGELYVDGVGSSVPGLFVSGTGPGQVNACSDVTYTLNYKNGSAAQACTTSANCTPATEACVGGVCAETAAVLTFNTPPGTTFQGITPPAGAICSTPTVGTAGAVTCTFTNPLPPGATGSMTVTVNVPCGTASGPLIAGNYQIGSAQESPLLGNKITTEIGCATDADCTSGKWCNETAHVCTPKLANGQPLPTDAPHTSPTLDGTCTAPAATLVCASGVCDADKKCGYANGDGTCTTGNGGVVCRSQACDPDGKCGYANGDGPCTAADAAVVCRSGACSVDGNCKPAGGCNVDADCTTGNWCSEGSHTCTPTLANGMPVPSDPAHASPILDGTCTTAAGALTCTSGVCDTNDGKCGYANGDGACTAANGGVVCRSQVCDPDGKCGYADGDGTCDATTGPVVCRSGACSVGGNCEPAGGCNVDADCTTGNWCNETSHACTPVLANGMPVPSDAAHASPILDGTCSSAAGALTCASGVCDTNDDLCGYADGDGPCTQANAAVVCRSGACSVDGNCEPAGGCNVDADCTTGNWCNETSHACTPTLANGTPVPSDPAHANPTLDGACSTDAGALTCTSGVCDTADDECGYANGDGPCTAANGDAVCRSGICATTGANAGKCVACVMDSQCPSTTCDTTSNTCVECTTSAQCSGAKPICDGTTHQCVPCAGDQGSGTPDACESTSSPFCFLGGPNQGSCGKCATNADCVGHDGNICDTTTGLCKSGCSQDADCPTGNWCNESAQMCAPKVPNGMPVPSDPAHTGPALDGICTPEAGKLTCASGVCDPKDNKCGLADGDGGCSNSEQCRTSPCDTISMICTPPAGCHTDADCKGTEFCQSGACTPKLPDGSACSAADECLGGDCEKGKCDSIIASGNGLSCAARPAGSSSEGSAGLLGLALAIAGLSRRRRR